MVNTRTCSLPLLFVLAALAPSPAGAQGSPGLKENLDLPFDVPPADQAEEEAPEIIVFYGQVYEANAVFFCLDQSLSMAEGGWRTLQRELARVVKEFSVAAEFGIVFFHREATVFPAEKRPARATPAMKQQAIAMVEATAASDQSTCFLAGLREALAMANRSAVKRKSIIFMSDGKATCVGEDTVTYVEKTLAEARSLNTQAIPIHTVGVGPEAVEHFLKALAAQSGGTYRRLSN